MIQETPNGNYIKIPDLLQRRIIELINNHISDYDTTNFESREELLTEAQSRIEPLVANIARKMLLKEGYEIFGPIIEEATNVAFESLQKEISNFIDKKETSISVNVEINKTIKERTSTIQMQKKYTKLRIGSGVLVIAVNGIMQNEDDNYYLSKDYQGCVTSIRFSEFLEKGDYVKILIIGAKSIEE